jgi:hypothetical protein
MPHQDPDQMAFEEMRKFLIELFRKAIPEISEKATLFFVHEKTYTFPASGEKIELKEYRIEREPGSFWEFTIELFVWDSVEYVFVLEFYDLLNSCLCYARLTRDKRGTPPPS